MLGPTWMAQYFTFTFGTFWNHPGVGAVLDLFLGVRGGLKTRFFIFLVFVLILGSGWLRLVQNHDYFGFWLAKTLLRVG